jgi:V/A-type H+-transporting ATPase subunit A
MGILQEEEKMLEIVQLVGSDALPEKQQLTLEIARMIREFFLQQNAFHEIDTYCPLKKSYLMMKTIIHFYNTANKSLESGVRISQILETKAKDKIANVKFEKDYESILANIQKEMSEEFEGIKDIK